MKANLIPAIILIVLGVLLLANNLVPNFRVWEMLLDWWPLVLVALGINMLVRKT
ncbi:hypothetical protein GCM10011521_08290 [Arenimonas soli]|uniref:LiaI-LiaF-like transmembrane region domain-containing protein n=1 Tax=Arenimonas soli TaxID=2269504 RepID=A0ABQ1HDM0_9GAMM|nr:DUF5668 domain-containing protein [Arenimonas soli]GGA72502.1 hypothetical protein GCM10011521_08290 [Arenimonas soli]